MALHQKIEKLLENLRLVMPARATWDDPLGGPPVVCDHANLHALLIVDADNLPIEGQLVSNLYAEMARYQRAAEYAADIAEIRYVKWKSAKELEYRAARASTGDVPASEPEPSAEGEKKKAAKAPKAARPTVAETEAAYRDHPDYERMSLEPRRLRAVAGVFDDLKWAFKMKSEHIREAGRLLGGYLGAERKGMPQQRDGDDAPDAIGAFEAMRREAESIVAASGSAADLAAWLSANPPGSTRTASTPE